MKVFLIGMPGSGKTTLGRQLAEHLGVDFVDLDQEIEKAEGKSISDIFNQQGEDAFRIQESRLLREWASSLLPFVMATGGGAPCFHKGMEVINEFGISVYLDCPVPELIARVKRNQERPLLLTSDENDLRVKLERMLQNRASCYMQATIVLKSPSLQALIKSVNAKK
jgi:shikimate kinase